MTALAPVLERLGISQYLEAFTAEGFDTWETLLDVTEEDLDALNVKRGHRRKLQREIASARGLPLDRPLRWPSPPMKLAGEDVGGDVEKLSSSPGNSGRGETPAKTGKRKYRRHPKPDELAPEKPPSAYVIFSNRTRENHKGQNLSFADMAKVVGQNWQALTAEQREAYEAEAAAAKHAYNEELAEYKKTESYMNYMEYLADFKAKQGIQTADAKRRKPEVDGVTQGTDGGARTSVHRQTAERGSGNRVRTASVDFTSAESVSSGQPSPLGPAPSSIPWLMQPQHTPAYNQKGGRDILIGQSPVSPTFSTSLSGVGSRSLNITGRPSSRVEPFGDSPARVDYGRGPNQPSRLLLEAESHTTTRLVTPPIPAVTAFPNDPRWPLRDTERLAESQITNLRLGVSSTLNLSAKKMEDARVAHQQSLVFFSDTSSTEASWIPSTLSPSLDPMVSSFKKPPPPVLPPLRASSSATSYGSIPSSHAAMLSRGVSSEERSRPQSVDRVGAHDAHQRQQSLHSESPTSQPYGGQERSPATRQPPEESQSSQDPCPSSPISVLLKASESIFDRESDRQIDGEG